MRTLIVSAATLAGLLCVGVAAQQTQPFPGPGTGIVPVSGTVNVGNSPTVNAVQRGGWTVALSNTPTVVIAAPDFLKKGVRYSITWSTGESETISVAQVGPAGWIRAGQTGGERWINLASARSIEEAH